MPRLHTGRRRAFLCWAVSARSVHVVRTPFVLAQAFAGPRSYLPMASHAYALSGNPLTMDDFHRRYLLLNQYLADPHPLTQLARGHCPGLATLTCQQVIELLLHWPGAAAQCHSGRGVVEFGLCPVDNSPFRIWGITPRSGRCRCMCISAATAGCDTLPGLPAHRTRDSHGRCPPSWLLRHGMQPLDEAHVCSTAVHARPLAPWPEHSCAGAGLAHGDRRSSG